MGVAWWNCCQGSPESETKPAETNKIKAGLSTKLVPHLHTCPCVLLILHHINYIFAHSVLLPPINFPIKKELRKIYAKKDKTNWKKKNHGAPPNTSLTLSVPLCCSWLSLTRWGNLLWAVTSAHRVSLNEGDFIILHNIKSSMRQKKMTGYFMN